MIGYLRCPYSGNIVNRVCCSPSCQRLAFSCTNCDQCDTLHEHDGITTTKRWQVLAPEIAAIKNQQYLIEQSKIDEIAKIANKLGSTLTNVSLLYTEDMRELIGQLTLKPQIKHIIDDIDAKYSDHITGSDIYSLIGDIQKKEIHLNKDIIQQRFLDLNKEYVGLLNQIESLMEKFTAKRVQLLRVAVPSKPIRMVLPKRSNDNDDKLKEQKCEPKVQHKSGLRTQEVVSSALSQTKPSITQSSIHLQPSRQPQINKAHDDDRKPRNDRRRGREREGRDRELRRGAPIKIADIEPGTEGLFLVGKVMSTTMTEYRGKIYQRCVIGDKTGVVDGSFHQNPLIKPGAVLQFWSAKASVYKQHILINTHSDEAIRESQVDIHTVNTRVNISEKSYIRSRD